MDLQVSPCGEGRFGAQGLGALVRKLGNLGLITYLKLAVDEGME